MPKIHGHGSVAPFLLLTRPCPSPCWRFAGVLSVWPPAGPPGAQVSVFGYPGYVANDACKAATAAPLQDGDLTCLGAVRVGDYVCQADAASYALSADTAASTAAADAFVRFRQLWSWIYRINCTSPLPVRSSGAARPQLARYAHACAGRRQAEAKLIISPPQGAATAHHAMLAPPHLPQLPASMRRGSGQIGLGLAGSYNVVAVRDGHVNVSITFEGPLAGGVAQALDRSYLADRQGQPYQYQVSHCSKVQEANDQQHCRDVCRLEPGGHHTHGP